MFLSESVKTSSVDSFNTDRTLLEMTEVCINLQELANDSVLAEYTLASRLKAGVLTEAESEEKKDGLIARVAQKIVDMIIAIRDWIVRFFKGIAAFFRKWWNRLFGKKDAGAQKADSSKSSGGIDNLGPRIPKSALKLLDTLHASLTRVHGEVLNDATNVFKYEGNANRAFSTHEKIVSSAEKTIEQEKKAKQLVAFSDSDGSKFSNMANKFEEYAKESQKELDVAKRDAETVLKNNKNVVSRAPKSEDKRLLDSAKAKVMTWRKFATYVNGFSSAARSFTTAVTA